MRIPFPLNLSIGTDIIAHSRLLKLHASTTHLQRLTTRFLHPREICELDKRFPDWRAYNKLSNVQQSKLSKHLAGRWAAKEAAKKAWGATLLSFRDLRVETSNNGKVQVVCQSYHDTGTASGEQLEDETALEQVAELSISHDGDYAVATVIATPLHPDILRTLQARKDAAFAKVRSPGTDTGENQAGKARTSFRSKVQNSGIDPT